MISLLLSSLLFSRAFSTYSLKNSNTKCLLQPVLTYWKTNEHLTVDSCANEAFWLSGCVSFMTGDCDEDGCDCFMYDVYCDDNTEVNVNYEIYELTTPTDAPTSNPTASLNPPEYPA